MERREMLKKLTRARIAVLEQFPFFGRLLMHLKFGVGECKTAFTNGEQVVFGEEFLEQLSHEEVQYVLLHELLHCCLNHCTRGRGKHQFVYNVACDIVVNSTILDMMKKPRLTVLGHPMMHQCPGGEEGREYIAEEVYQMLLKSTPQELEKRYNRLFDLHQWEQTDATLESIWKERLAKAAKGYGLHGVPNGMKRQIKEILHTPKTNWKALLHQFLQHKKMDYSYSSPDRRYPGPVILPSFGAWGNPNSLENIWFLVDASGSVSDVTFARILAELENAFAHVAHLSGKLSFFNTKVTPPVPFSSLEEFKTIPLSGSGGTNFQAIFNALKARLQKGECLPKAMVIATDGYDDFPSESAALGVPVIWLIVDSDVRPPWGVYAYVGE